MGGSITVIEGVQADVRTEGDSPRTSKDSAAAVLGDSEASKEGDHATREQTDSDRE